MVSPHFAVVFDFDDTLVPDSTTAFLQSRNVDTQDFWQVRARALVEQGYDQPLHYLQLMLDMAQSGGILEGLTHTQLRDFGSTLDEHFFTGLPEMFDDLRESIAPFRDFTLDFYIVSSGIQSIIEGSQIVQQYFSGVYACRFGQDPDSDVIRHVRRCVTFTEKTRYLFEINKGIDPLESDRNPGLVNREVPEGERRIPFGNMVYVGDGLTDIPCFSLVRKNGGLSYGGLRS